MLRMTLVSSLRGIKGQSTHNFAASPNKHTKRGQDLIYKGSHQYTGTRTSAAWAIWNQRLDQKRMFGNSWV